MSKKTQETPSFEEAMNELEALVDSMENSTLSLEESLEKFERGVQLTRLCQQALSRAEQEVRVLSGADDETDFTELVQQVQPDSHGMG